MKRICAVLIVFVTVFNLMIFPDLLTFAADSKYRFSAEFNQRLLEGRTNAIPEKETRWLTGGNAFISWDIQTPNGGQLDSGRFVLQYPLADGHIAQLIIEKSALAAAVTYDVYNATDSNAKPVSGGHKIYGASVSTASGVSYFIHTQHGAVLGQANYVPFSQFRNDGEADGYLADKSKTKPTFKINRGEGFSFKFENRTVQFLWDAVNGRFYYMTDAFEQSRIFPVKLFLATDAGHPVYAEPAILHIATGIGADRIVSNPIANGKRLNDILNHTASANPPETPAADDNLMEIRIKIPEVWDSAASKFVTGDVGQKEIGFKLNLINNQNQMQVIIDNIFDPKTASVSGATFYAAAKNGGKPERVNAANEPDANGEYVLFTLGAMSYGQIYEATAAFTGSGGYAFNYTKIDYGKFYTFMRYGIAYIGDKYYAIIEPYRGYAGYYRLMTDPVGDENDIGKSVTSYSDGLSAVYMPLTLQANSEHQYTYQVRFSPGVTFESGAGSRIYSQRMHYQAGKGTLSLSIPGNFDILAHRFVPFDELSAEPDKDAKGQLYLDLRWEIGREAVIESLLDRSSNKEINLKYHVYTTTQPHADTSDITLLTTVIMNIKRDGGKIRVTYSDTGGKLVFTEEVPETRYFTGAGSTANDAVIETAARDTIYRAYVRLKTLAYDKNAITVPATPASAIDFYYPNIYFMNVQPAALTTYRPDGGGHTATTESLEKTVGRSLYDSMTLDTYDRLTPPAPQGLTAYDAKTVTTEGITTETSMKIKWIVPGEKIKDYFAGSYPYDANTVAFNLYIAQSETALQPVAAASEAADRIQPPVIAFAFSDLYDAAAQRFYFSDINGKTAYAADGKTVRDYLRAGNAVCVTDIPASLSADAVALIMNGALHTSDYVLDGLDKNQQYYFSMDMAAGFFMNNDPLPKKKQLSMMTGIVAETTKSDENKPGPADKYPPAPVLSKENVSLAAATILWHKITEPDAQDTGARLEYEMLRVRDKPLDAVLLDSRINFASFFNETVKNENKTGWQTNGTALLVWDGQAFAAPVTGQYTYDAAASTVRLTDCTLSPNQLYFYYVRTVRTVDGKTLYSVWSDISVTTTPVKPPLNLKVDRADKAISYDKKRQFLISFDAPVTDVSRLGIDYALQYTIKRENGEWSPPFTMPATALAADGSTGVSTVEGYRFFKYVVGKTYENDRWTDLIPGSAYSIRVRLIDLKTGDHSVYSNIAETRTEQDQGEYDHGKIRDEWLAYLKSELLKLSKNPYWYARDTKSETTVIYRPDRFDELLTNARGAQLELVASDAFTAEYYLPAASLFTANARNKGFKIINGDMEILLPPNALDDSNHSAFISIRDRVKSGAVKDYYVRITVTKQFVSQPIAGLSPLSYQTAILVETIGTLKETADFDNEIFDSLMREITKQAESKWNAKEIAAIIKDKDSDEKIVRLIAGIVADARKYMTGRIEKALNRTLKYEYAADTLSAPMILRYYTGEPGVSVQGYQAQPHTNGLWVARETVPFSGGCAMSVNTPGTFIFAGNTVYLPGIESMQGSADMIDMIIKYGLEDYFGKSAAFSMNARVTGIMAAGVAARLMGAARTADPVAFLKEKGITVSTRRNQQPISKQEAIRLLMGVYENRTNTTMASLRITDYTMTANIRNLSDQHAPVVRAALQIGIISDKNMDAKTNITVRAFLEMLLKLKDRTNL